MEFNLRGKTDDRFDYTCLSRFLDKKFPSKVTMQPTANTFITECRALNFNWLVVWCMGYVLTNGYLLNEMTEKKNYLAVPKGIFRTWREGLRAGLLRIEKAMVFDDLVATYGAGFEAQVKAVFDEVVKFEATDEFEGLPPDIETPVKWPEPVKPEPVKEEPKPEPTPGVKAPWQLKLAGILGTIGSVWWLAKWFLPGSAGKIGDVIIELLKRLVGM